MKVLIYAGDGIRAAGIRDIIDEVVEKNPPEVKIGYDSGEDTYVAQTKGVSREEVRVYLLSEGKAQRLPQWLERLGEQIAGALREKMSLDKSQVICGVKFP